MIQIRGNDAQSRQGRGDGGTAGKMWRKAGVVTMVINTGEGLDA